MRQVDAALQPRPPDDAGAGPSAKEQPMGRTEASADAAMRALLVRCSAAENWLGPCVCCSAMR